MAMRLSQGLAIRSPDTALVEFIDCALGRTHLKVSSVSILTASCRATHWEHLANGINAVTNGNSAMANECGFEEISDDALVIQVQQGDQRAFGLLMQRYQDRLYSVAPSILHQIQNAQDAAEQAFLQLWQKRHTYNPRWRFTTWMYRIVTNICIDEHRCQQRRLQVPQDVLSLLPRLVTPRLWTTNTTNVNKRSTRLSAP